jgi:hypothetical protein
MSDELYRGVSKEKYDKDGKELKPYKIGQFESIISLDEGHRLGEGFTLDSTVNNSIVKHQKDSSRYPTSGISTTPIFDRAKYYALHGGKKEKGYVFVFDRNVLDKYSVKEFVVSEYVEFPNVPIDKEVILYSEMNTINELSKELIIRVEEVFKD